MPAYCVLLTPHCVGEANMSVSLLCHTDTTLCRRGQYVCLLCLTDTTLCRRGLYLSVCVLLIPHCRRGLYMPVFYVLYTSHCVGEADICLPSMSYTHHIV